jgi:hypothetical protein
MSWLVSEHVKVACRVHRGRAGGRVMEMVSIHGQCHDSIATRHGENSPSGSSTCMGSQGRISLRATCLLLLLYTLLPRDDQRSLGRVRKWFDGPACMDGAVRVMDVMVVCVSVVDWEESDKRWLDGMKGEMGAGEC